MFMQGPYKGSEYCEVIFEKGGKQGTKMKTNQSRNRMPKYELYSVGWVDTKIQQGVYRNTSNSRM
eukprot:204131-Karenia_brevis.AAC.1